jgi:hypothetical protein
MRPSCLLRKSSGRALVTAIVLSVSGCAVAIEDEPGVVVEQREHELDRAQTTEGAEPAPADGVVQGLGEPILSTPSGPGKPTPDPWLEDTEPGKPTPDPWKTGSGSGSGTGTEDQGSQSASSGK